MKQNQLCVTVTQNHLYVLCPNRDSFLRFLETFGDVECFFDDDDMGAPVGGATECEVPFEGLDEMHSLLADIHRAAVELGYRHVSVHYRSLPTEATCERCSGPLTDETCCTRCIAAEGGR